MESVIYDSIDSSALHCIELLFRHLLYTNGTCHFSIYVLFPFVPTHFVRISTTQEGQQTFSDFMFFEIECRKVASRSKSPLVTCPGY